MTRAAAEKEVLRIIRKWRPRLNIEKRWIINVEFHTDYTWPHDERGTSAMITPDPGYFTADLLVNIDSIDRDEDDLEYTILHELIHIPLWALTTIAHGALGEDQERHWRHVMEAAVETFTAALLAK